MATDADTDRTILAAELALGVLEGADLDRARTLQREDPAFAAEVDAWHAHFATWFASWPDAEPSETLRYRILAAAGIRAANDNRATPWKWATAITGALAAVFGLMLLAPPERVVVPPPAPPAQVEQAPGMMVAFSIDKGAKSLPAMVDVSRHQVRLPAGLDVPDGRVAQLWLIVGEAPPQPLGLFAPTANGLAATITTDRDIPAGSVLAISIEPPGGSPTGLPTGPVVATGELKPV